MKRECASVIGSKGTPIEGPVASFRDLNARPGKGPTYTRYPLAEIESVEPILEPAHPTAPEASEPDPAASTGAPVDSVPPGGVHIQIPTVG